MIGSRIALLSVLWVLGLTDGRAGPDPAPASGAPAQPFHIEGLTNVFRVGTNLFSGSSPRSGASFAHLAGLGIKTIISVDGRRPDLATARRHGLRYVHVPHGYGQIETERQCQLLKAVRTLPGPFYVHCHHGQHRGPAAVAVIGLGSGIWNSAQAEAWMKLAGTATNYVGLFESVRQFQPLAVRDWAKAELTDAMLGTRLVEAMVEIDRAWDHLKKLKEARYRRLGNQPDIDPANEAVILWEHLRETQRLPDAMALGRDFVERLRFTENQVREAENLMRQLPGKWDDEQRLILDRRLDAVGEACSNCHQRYRDRAQGKQSLPK